MRCATGQRCLLVSAHPATPDCNRLLIGRVIVTVTDWHGTFAGPAWSFAEGGVPCPRGTQADGKACTFVAFLDCDLQPLPPEEDCIDANEPVDIEIDIHEPIDVHVVAS